MQHRLAELPGELGCRGEPGFPAEKAVECEVRSGECNLGEGRHTAKDCRHNHQLHPTPQQLNRQEIHVRNDSSHAEGALPFRNFEVGVHDVHCNAHNSH
jgi:hypothetical protein